VVTCKTDGSRTGKSQRQRLLILDDSIAEKPYSDENEIVCYHRDHSKKRHIKGINFLNCLFEKDGISLPVAAEIIEKDECLLIQKKEKRNAVHQLQRTN
jgi:hypothetical protein